MIFPRVGILILLGIHTIDCSCIDNPITVQGVLTTCSAFLNAPENQCRCTDIAVQQACCLTCQEKSAVDCSCIDKRITVNGADTSCSTFLNEPGKLCRCTDNPVKTLCCKTCKEKEAEVEVQCVGCVDKLSQTSTFKYTVRYPDGHEELTTYTSCADVKNDGLCDTNAKSLCCASCGESAAPPAESQENGCVDKLSQTSPFKYTVRYPDGHEELTTYTSCADVKNDGLCDTNAKSLCCASCGESAAPPAEPQENGDENSPDAQGENDTGGDGENPAPGGQENHPGNEEGAKPGGKDSEENMPEKEEGGKPGGKGKAADKKKEKPPNNRNDKKEEDEQKEEKQDEKEKKDEECTNPPDTFSAPNAKGSIWVRAPNSKCKLYGKECRCIQFVRKACCEINAVRSKCCKLCKNARCSNK